jgi:hypothetical protein
MRRPFRLPRLTWTAWSWPCWTLCNTVWRAIPRAFAASSRPGRERPADRPPALAPQDGQDEREAQIALGKLLEQAGAGRRPDTRVTVGEAVARYMEVAELDVSTRRTYEGYIRRTILPALGSIELRKIRGPMLDSFYARLRKCGDLACNGRPFIEHTMFPALEVAPGGLEADHRDDPGCDQIRAARRWR